MTLAPDILETRSLWDAHRDDAVGDPLAERVYSSRLLGADPRLVLHGGGNTSVKLTDCDVFGDELDVVYVKASGRDLATIEADDFTALRLDHLVRLAALPTLGDVEMAREIRAASLDPSARPASVEALLHAILPARFVDHTHPDAVLSVMNTPSGAARIEEIYGGELVVVPYVMPGFPLARDAARAFAENATSATIGLALMNHGIFTFGDTAREAYERTIELVARAEQYLRAHDAWSLPPRRPARTNRTATAALRADLAAVAGRPLVVRSTGIGLAPCPALQRGPATPDHVLRTKRVPMHGRDVGAYAASYQAYFEAHADRATTPVTMLDAAPRVIVDAELGLLAAGTDAEAAAVTADIYAHTVEIVERAERLEAWRALPAGDVFDVEYWDLEQAKLAQGGSRPPFTGEIAMVTGAASGIGRACALEFLELGAAVVGIDLDEAVERVSGSSAYLGVRADVCSELDLERAFDLAVSAFGGLDMLVLNAGVFPTSIPVSALYAEQWRHVMAVNVDANVTLLRLAFPLLSLAPNGGRVVVNGSKNVPAPGPGAAAYSASKAALTQLARVVALEWGAANVRVNVVHPNAVFDTGIWSEDVIAQRAASYGLPTEEYRSNNVLRTEVKSRDVARLVTDLCGPAFAKTTGAQIPIDGGNERLI